MKTISKALLAVSFLILAAGCARHQEEARLGEPKYRAITGVASTAPPSIRSAGQVGSGPAGASTIFYSSDIFSTRPEDNNLVSEVRQAITQAPELGMIAPSIQIGASSGRVTLFGTVGSQEQKQIIESLALHTPGVVGVESHLEVLAAGSPEALSAMSRANGENLSDVNTRAGVLGSAMQSGADAASDSVTHGTGADALSAATRESDDGFGGTSRLERSGVELSATSRTNGLSSIYSGVVSNRLDSTAEQLDPTSRAENRSRVYLQTNEPGATYIREKNEPGPIGRPADRGQTGLSVNVQGTSEIDRTLAQQISQELRADASLASAISHVSVSVADGRVTVQGTVKNDVQKREIESAIQRATGVSSIDNQLRVSAVPQPPPRDP
jgi:osmotically-inducible protein OsmY